MVLSRSINGGPNEDTSDSHEPHRLSDEIDSTCSTPFVSAPSSPGRGSATSAGYFFSAPASPMHYMLSKTPFTSSGGTDSSNACGSFEFEFSSRFSPTGSAGNGSMISADELFLNGQIRPMKLSSHLQRPQHLAPLVDLEDEDEYDENRNGKDSEFVMRGRDFRLRNKSLHRKARSMSPLRSSECQWHENGEEIAAGEERSELELELEVSDQKQTETTPSCSASSSRSSSSGRNSKKWIFLKDLLYRSKSEGRANSKERFWSSISFSPSSKEKKLISPSLTPSSSRDEKDKVQTETEKQRSKKKVAAGKPTNGVAAKRRNPPSAHELHYTSKRAQAEEMKKRTFLPYRQGLLGCLGFSSKGYSALNGFTRSLNPVSSR